MSAAAGLTEELAFRGFLLSFLLHGPGGGTAATAVGGLPLPLALFASSALFGFLHFPLFGANTVVEFVLACGFGYAYIASDYNLAVPILVHTVYDLATLFPHLEGGRC